MNRTKLLYYFTVLFYTVCAALYLWKRELGIGMLGNHIQYIHETTKPQEANHAISINSTDYRTEKLVTVFTSFMDETNMSFSQYRAFVQKNFLRMTQFSCFREKVQFVVATNSKETRNLISREYPRVRFIDTVLRGKFTSPMYKDIVRDAMKASESFFYMQVNACNLYDNSLVLTLEAVRQAWRRGLVRQKILIYGIRSDFNIENITIGDETEFLRHFEKAKLFRHDALDYFIMTKETNDWDTFPESLMGRGFYDPYISNYAAHNEVETFDGTKSIRLLHQVRENDGGALSKRLDTYGTEEARNIGLVKLRTDHYSTTCTRYRTEISGDGSYVTIYDKNTDSMLKWDAGRNETYFSTSHRYWVEYEEKETTQEIESSPSLVIVVLAFSKPDSLGRLLNSLRDANYHGDRIDLIISLDVGRMGYYDLPTLITSKQFLWTQGEKRVALKSTHRGQMYQWLEASSIVDDDGQTLMLVVEETVVLSPYWYEYLMAVLSHHPDVPPDEQIAGWSLEAPIGRYSEHFQPSQFFDLFAGKSSVVYSGIKPVRNFIPVRGIWNDFVKWFATKSETVTTDLLSDSIISRLLNLGSHSGWESKVWSS